MCARHGIEQSLLLVTMAMPLWYKAWDKQEKYFIFLYPSYVGVSLLQPALYSCNGA